MNSIDKELIEQGTGSTEMAPKPNEKVIQLASFRAQRDVSISSSQVSSTYIGHTEEGHWKEVSPKKDRVLFRKALFKRIDEANRKRLQEAFYRITDSIDPDLHTVERSNCFDEWKDLMELLSRKAEYMTINHRKILGALITATRNKDVSDFGNDALRELQEGTNVLRQPRVTRRDSKRIIANLLNSGLDIMIPLVPNDLDDGTANSLEDMMASILEKSHGEG